MTATIGAESLVELAGHHVAGEPYRFKHGWVPIGGLEGLGPSGPSGPPAEQLHMITDEHGIRHWGQYGGAGVLVRHTDKTGQKRYFLQQRAKGVHLGGTWSTPGGGIDPGETVDQAAKREVEEEIGKIPGTLTHSHTVTADYGGWKYHTVVMDSPKQFTPEGGGVHAWEDAGSGWFTPEQIDKMPLHPGFASSWPTVRDAGGDLTIYPGPAEAKKMAEEKQAKKDALAARGIFTGLTKQDAYQRGAAEAKSSGKPTFFVSNDDFHEGRTYSYAAIKPKYPPYYVMTPGGDFIYYKGGGKGIKLNPQTDLSSVGEQALAIELAAINGHHVAGTAYHYYHGWKNREGQSLVADALKGTHTSGSSKEEKAAKTAALLSALKAAKASGKAQHVAVVRVKGKGGKNTGTWKHVETAAGAVDLGPDSNRTRYTITPGGEITKYQGKRALYTLNTREHIAAGLLPKPEGKGARPSTGAANLRRVINDEDPGSTLGADEKAQNAAAHANTEAARAAADAKTGGDQAHPAGHTAAEAAKAQAAASPTSAISATVPSGSGKNNKKLMWLLNHEQPNSLAPSNASPNSMVTHALVSVHESGDGPLYVTKGLGGWHITGVKPSKAAHFEIDTDLNVHSVSSQGKGYVYKPDTMDKVVAKQFSAEALARAEKHAAGQPVSAPGPRPNSIAIAKKVAAEHKAAQAAKPAAVLPGSDLSKGDTVSGKDVVSGRSYTGTVQGFGHLTGGKPYVLVKEAGPSGKVHAEQPNDLAKVTKPARGEAVRVTGTGEPAPAPSAPAGPEAELHSLVAGSSVKASPGGGAAFPYPATMTKSQAAGYHKLAKGLKAAHETGKPQYLAPSYKKYGQFVKLAKAPVIGPAKDQHHFYYKINPDHSVQMVHHENGTSTVPPDTLLKFVGSQFAKPAGGAPKAPSAPDVTPRTVHGAQMTEPAEIEAHKKLDAYTSTKKPVPGGDDLTLHDAMYKALWRAKASGSYPRYVHGTGNGYSYSQGKPEGTGAYYEVKPDLSVTRHTSSGGTIEMMPSDIYQMSGGNDPVKNPALGQPPAPAMSDLVGKMKALGPEHVSPATKDLAAYVHSKDAVPEISDLTLGDALHKALKRANGGGETRYVRMGDGGGYDYRTNKPDTTPFYEVRPDFTVIRHSALNGQVTMDHSSLLDKISHKETGTLGPAAPVTAASVSASADPMQIMKKQIATSPVGTGISGHLLTAMKDAQTYKQDHYVKVQPSGNWSYNGTVQPSEGNYIKVHSGGVSGELYHEGKTDHLNPASMHALGGLTNQHGSIDGLPGLEPGMETKSAQAKAAAAGAAAGAAETAKEAAAKATPKVYPPGPEGDLQKAIDSKTEADKLTGMTKSEAVHKALVQSAKTGKTTYAVNKGASGGSDYTFTMTRPAEGTPNYEVHPDSTLTYHGAPSGPLTITPENVAKIVKGKSSFGPVKTSSAPKFGPTLPPLSSLDKFTAGEGALSVGKNVAPPTPAELEAAKHLLSQVHGMQSGGGMGSESELKKHYKGSVQLTTSQHSALLSYTGSGYHDINGALRHNKGSLDAITSAHTKGKIRRIDEAMAAYQSDKPVRVYRSVDAGVFPDENITGNVFTDHGFISTSISPNHSWSGGAKISITVPKGSHMSYPLGVGASNHPGEHEVLLPRGTRFQVISDTKVSGGSYEGPTRHIEMIALPPYLHEAETVPKALKKTPHAPAIKQGIVKKPTTAEFITAKQALAEVEHQGDTVTPFETVKGGYLNHLHGAPMTSGEKSALSYYTHHTYKYINGRHDKFDDVKGLRDVPLEQLDPHIQEHVKNLDSLIGSYQLPHTVKVWRSGMAPEGVADSTGLIYTDKGFVSTTFKHDYAAKFHNTPEHGNDAIYEIIVPRGSNAVIPSANGIGAGYEYELTLPRGSRFHVMSDVVIGGKHHIKMVALPPVTQGVSSEQLAKDQAAETAAQAAASSVKVPVGTG